MSKQVIESVWAGMEETPLIKITGVINENFKGNIYLKNESRNPTGKFTDRIAKKLY